mmetsp:Transcript_5615/g.10007  ORF Transcript_5615/g.10007 Transcript_5615/m.10007 type:complete len:260 (+) Transcript_5615:666-1445(+)
MLLLKFRSGFLIRSLEFDALPEPTIIQVLFTDLCSQIVALDGSQQQVHNGMVVFRVSYVFENDLVEFLLVLFTIQLSQSKRQRLLLLAEILDNTRREPIQRYNQGWQHLTRRQMRESILAQVNIGKTLQQGLVSLLPFGFTQDTSQLRGWSHPRKQQLFLKDKVPLHEHLENVKPVVKVVDIIMRQVEHSFLHGCNQVVHIRHLATNRVVWEGEHIQLPTSLAIVCEVQRGLLEHRLRHLLHSHRGETSRIIQSLGTNR